MQQTVVQQTATALVQSAGSQLAEVMLIDLSGKQLLSKSVVLQMGINQILLQSAKRPLYSTGTYPGWRTAQPSVCKRIVQLVI
jgi:hypothetical protein